MIYFVIALIASSIGSLLGIGGGVIIVPTLLSLGIGKELSSVSSSLTVFCMAIISSYTYMKRKQGNIKVSLLIAAGCIPGSYIGVYLNSKISLQLFKILFDCLIIILLILTFIKNKIREMKLGSAAKVIFGVFIGILSGLFGIGGGPITVPILLVFFSLSQKEVSATSSYITLITSLTSVLSNVVSGNNNLSLALFMIPGAVLGARIGTYYNKKVNDRSLMVLFNSLLIFLLLKQFI